jgi:ceramide glucosyltransferase
VVVFYFLSAIAIWLGLLSLRGGLRFSSYVHQEIGKQAADYTPFVTVIAPFRGADQNQRQNLTALLEQNYPAYKIVFVTDAATDPGLRMIEEVCSARSDKLQFVDKSQSNSISKASEGWSEQPPPQANDNLKIVGLKVVIAGAAVESGQKVHNLQAAVSEIDPKSEVIVFVDSDARPHGNWLRLLVAPLVDEKIGAATGYRWFTAPALSISGQLRSVWNASITSALGEQSSKNFCWGGSTAIRRRTFEKLDVVQRWRGTVSDDFTLTRVLQEAKLPIKFVPGCLIVSEEQDRFSELMEFTTRQLKITRVYAPHLWKALLMGSSLFVIVFFGGLFLIPVRLWLGLSVTTPALLLLIVFVLGAAKSWIRLNAAESALKNYRISLRKDLIAHLLLWPLASALFLFNALAAAFSRRISWRGITYELKSPVEAVIIAREPNQDA